MYLPELLQAVNAQPLDFPGISGELKPFFAFVPDTKRSLVLPGNDYIEIDIGNLQNDVVVGDFAFSFSTIATNFADNILNKYLACIILC
jgi:hypothetical protein